MERIRQIVVGVVVGLFVQGAYAQSTGRDFSGTWVLDTTRSGSLDQNNDLPKSTIVIARSGDQFVIESTRGSVQESMRFGFESLEALRLQLKRSGAGATG